MAACLLLLTALTAPEPARAQDASDIAHTLSFSDVPGDSGTVMVNAPDLTIRRLSALLIIDDRLDVLPLAEEGDRRFVGSFPTPARSLQYQFQIEYENGQAAVSKGYVATVSCAQTSAAGTKVGAHEIRLLQAEKLQEEVRLMGILSEWLASEELAPLSERER